MPYHKITRLRLDPQPSACVRHDAWRSEALPVPPAEVAGKGWAAVLESLRVRRVCTQSESAARVTRVPPRLATELDCSPPHDLCRSKSTCVLRSAPHLLFSSSAAAACLRALCSTTRCWGPSCRSARSHACQCSAGDSLAASGCSCCAAAAPCPPC